MDSQTRRQEKQTRAVSPDSSYRQVTSVLSNEDMLESYMDRRKRKTTVPGLRNGSILKQTVENSYPINLKKSVNHSRQNSSMRNNPEKIGYRLKNDV
jgi:hypothetical protein